MEQATAQAFDDLSNNNPLSVAVINNTTTIQSNSKPFIEANTIEGTLEEIQRRHIIPTYRDSEALISQSEFIEVTNDVVHEVFEAERIASPSIRLSHPIKGRVPEARNKPAAELNEWEKTLYYERMAFIQEISSITDTIDGQQLSLTVGGVKAYNLDNLQNRKGADEHFKVFIGFKVQVCTNLCVWTDGFAGDIRVKNLEQLRTAIYMLVTSFDAITHLKQLEALQHYSLTEQQFAHLIGRCKMYQYLPTSLKQDIPELQFGESQINSVCKDYFRDNSFCRNAEGDMSLWRLYNLFTSANKASYIDSFLDRTVGAATFTSQLAGALEHKSSNWFIG
jgi:hypothetical protein